MRAKGQGLIRMEQWPAEPPSPKKVDPRTFGLALRQLCASWMPPKRPFRYARWMIESGREFGVDPFLLAALIYRQSRCLPRERDSYGMGLAMINPRMHGAYIRRRRYRYWVYEGGAWKRHELPLPRYAFVPGNLMRAQAAIYFAAALLHVNQQQCPRNDGAFGSVPHRSPVSHFIWGDRVKGAGAEDRVLRARRRLLEYYSGARPAPLGRFKELLLHCPVDGAPRKITSGMGSDREDGKRFHKGVDFASTWGEPVRAVADGQVTLAGIDRRGAGPINVDPEPEQVKEKLRSEKVGPGGLFVMVRHAEGLLSAYMHLSRYVVKAGQRVKGGEILGYVGRSGIKESGAHLHFELRHGGKHIDPMPHLEPYVFGPRDTYMGQRVAAEERRVRRRRRVERWRAYKAKLRAKQQAAAK
jgi:murein DD-endopeptidase MepM/ murein hydrolase activator NlpD